jgi:excisionase family DNA binding protein
MRASTPGDPNDDELSERRGRTRGGRSNKPPPGERYLTVRQVAQSWQVSERTVRRMIADGRIKVVRFGRLVRIPVYFDSPLKWLR